MSQEPVDPLLAACGLYCGACYHYRAAFPAGAYLLEGRSPEGFTCRGCRSDRLYLHPGCSQCDIRSCAEGRGYAHCGECEDLPCERISAFISDGHTHHLNVLDKLGELNRLGQQRWLEAQACFWQCPCGAKLSWYDRVCPECGRPVDHL